MAGNAKTRRVKYLDQLVPTSGKERRAALQKLYEKSRILHMQNKQSCLLGFPAFKPSFEKSWSQGNTQTLKGVQFCWLHCLCKDVTKS